MAGADTFRVGLRIDRYELTRQIAEGGFGVIWVARDVNLGRDLAIKFLLPQHNSNAEIVSRFVGEARTLARVVHPGIVTVYESGEVSGTNTKADGTAFILMELLEGETLSQRLRRTGPLPATTAMEICRQVANALGAAHQLGMIHRDLKPDNIMLVKDPAIAIGERAKVLDFGIAKNAANSTTTAATQIGMVFGTPAYMSPEQCRSSTDVTPASDVYSLGCILFELLLGRPPFLGSGMGELFAAHLMTAPPSPRSLNPTLPRHLDDVIGAMLAKDPTGRPASMMVVERILEDSRLDKAPARTRTLGGATLLASALPFSKPGVAVEMGPPRTPVMGVPVTTERGHTPAANPTPVSQPAVAPRPTPGQMAAAEASTLLGAARPAMPTAAEAAELMRKRTPTTSSPPVGPATAPVAAQVTPPTHATPTTMTSAVGQSTPRTPPAGGSKLWLVGAVLGAIAIAVVIVVVAGGGGSRGGAAAQPSGSAPAGSATASGSAAIAPGSGTTNAGSATTSAGSATTNAGSGSVDAGSATTNAGSATTNAGSATTGSGSADGGSATTNAGSATPNAGSAMHAGSATGSAAGSAVVHTGSGAGSAVVPHTGSGAGSAVVPHTDSGAGSAKKPKDPGKGSGSAKCQGRGCILDGQF